MRAVPDLAAIRRTRGVALQEIARATKISIRYLRAIESGEIQKLPGAVYTRSYIRQYAEAIDLDGESLIEGYGLGAEPEPQAATGGEERPGVLRRVLAGFLAPRVV